MKVDIPQGQCYKPTVYDFAIIPGVLVDEVMQDFYHQQ